MSEAFGEGEAIPARFSAEGEDISPPLTWSQAPEGVGSFAVMVEDPDVPSDQPFVHWIAVNIPAQETSLRQGLPTGPRLELPEGLVQGANSKGSTGWTGMKPPRGDPPHRYHFQVFALDGKLAVPPGASREEVIEAMQGRVLAAGELVGTFQRGR